MVMLTTAFWGECYIDLLNYKHYKNVKIMRTDTTLP